MRVARLLLTAATIVTAIPVMAQETARDPAVIGDEIAARQALMETLETDLAQLEADAKADTVDATRTALLFGSIRSALAAFPHLFPDDTNLLGGATPLDGVTTAADPKIWTEFSAFFAQSRQSMAAAEGLAGVTDAADLATKTVALRATCQGCHAQYLYYDPFALPAP